LYELVTQYFIFYINSASIEPFYTVIIQQSLLEPRWIYF